MSESGKPFVRDYHIPKSNKDAWLGGLRFAQNQYEPELQKLRSQLAVAKEALESWLTFRGGLNGDYAWFRSEDAAKQTKDFLAQLTASEGSEIRGDSK